jgi:hypothetical protein
VGFLRYLSRRSAPNLCVDVSACTGGRARDRTIPGSSLDRRPVERGCDVCGDDLDVAGLDAAGMGAAGRRIGFIEIRSIQLLDKQLLGRRRGRDRRRASHGSVPTNL